MHRIERKEYLDWLNRWKDQQIVKVVSGVRRCGKSTLFEIFRDHLISEGVNENQIIALNLEEIENEPLLSYRALHDHIKTRLNPKKMNYIFLDEIQHVDQFERAVDSLFTKKNCDVYITGSNAYFMSGELATLLSGRYVELKMLPLSFKEFCEGQKQKEQKEQKDKAELFNTYIENGSFPYTLHYSLDNTSAREYLKDIYNTVLLKDIVARLNISDVSMLENVTKFMLHNIGSRNSPTKIANTLKSAGKNVDQKTVDKYLKGLTDSLLLYEANRYNIKGRQYLTTQSKYYAVDIALRNTLVQGKDTDTGHIIENIVYLELLRKGYEVYVGSGDEDSEIDFIAQSGNETLYIQVAATTLDDAVLKRELKPLKQIKDNHPKILITLDTLLGNVAYDGIQKRNLIGWLLA